MNLLESAGFSRSNPYYIVKQGKVRKEWDLTSFVYYILACFSVLSIRCFMSASIKSADVLLVV